MTTPIDPSTLSPKQRVALVARMRREATRLTACNTWANGHRMSVGLDDSYIMTPMLDMIATAVQDTVDADRGRLLVSSPPQIGKSVTVAIWGAVRALVGNPDLRVVVASYSESLARRHVRTARDLVARYGSGATDSLSGLPMPDRMGIALHDRKATESEWQIAGARGGMYAVGVGGSLSGKPADLLIIDDPIKGMAEADSEVQKERLMEWWQSVALARLSPTASVILVQTRWTEDDLAGKMLEEGGWDYLNFPAIAAEGIPDALDRAPGEPLITSRGHTLETWEATAAAVGPRVWGALYLGIPTPTKGGLFHTEWMDRYREPVAPNLQLRVVSVDPAETGKRDEAGIVAMGTTSDRRIAVTHDRSGRMTSDQWARAAVVLALETKAQEVIFEAYSTETTYRRVIIEAWRDVERDLRFIRRHRNDVAAASAAMPEAADRFYDLMGLSASGGDSPPFRVTGYRGKGDKVARAAGSRQATETGRMFIVGALPGLERQMTTWQLGQSSPDRVDAMVHGFNRLTELLGQSSHIATPVRPAVDSNSGLSQRMGRTLKFD